MKKVIELNKEGDYIAKHIKYILFILALMMKFFSRFTAILMVAFTIVAINLSSVAAFEVADIIIIGNQRFVDETIKVYIEFGVGSEIGEEELNGALKDLYNTGFFKDVKISVRDNIVYIDVVESLFVRNINFKGNKKLSADELKEVMIHRPRSLFSPFKMKREIEFMKELYFRKGYAAVNIESQVVENKDTVDINYVITEGKAKYITKIEFRGNSNFTDRKLRSVISEKEKTFWRIFSSVDKYDPDRVEFDKELLMRFYRDRGFVDFDVIAATVNTDADGNFQVIFDVFEGEKYKINTIDIVSEIEDTLPDLSKYLVLKPGNTYMETKVLDIINTLTDALGDLGFAFVNIVPDLKKREGATLDIKFIIQKSPKIYLDKIDIKNNTRTMDYVIRREMRLDEGDPFNTSKIKRSMQRIKNLGYFNSVNYKTTKSKDFDRVNLEIDVEETSTGAVDFGASYTTGADQGVSGFISLSEKNFLGKGLETNLRFTKSSKKTNITFGLMDPYFLNKNLRAGIKLFSEEVDRRDQSGYTYSTIGGSVSGSYNITEYLEHTLRYSLKQEKLKDIPANSSIFIKSQEGSNLHSSIGHNFMYNRLDDDFDPTRGYGVSLAQEYAGVGGDIKYFKNLANAALYIPLLKDKLIFKNNLRGGWVNGHSGTKLRINDKFFLGQDDIRGFEVSGIGPRDKASGEALGATKYVVLKTELIFPLGFAEESGLRGYIFHDYGNLWDSEESSDAILQNNSYRASWGYGLTMNTPLGPLTLDWGHAYKKESFDKRRNFRLSYRTPL